MRIFIFVAPLPSPMVSAGVGASRLVPSVVTMLGLSPSPSPPAFSGTVLGLPYRVRPKSSVDFDSEHAAAAEGVLEASGSSVGSADGRAAGSSPIVPVESVAGCETADSSSSARTSAGHVAVASASFTTSTTLPSSPPTAVFVTLAPCPAVATPSVDLTWG